MSIRATLSEIFKTEYDQSWHWHLYMGWLWLLIQIQEPHYRRSLNDGHSHDYKWQCTSCGVDADKHKPCFWGRNLMQTCTLCGWRGPNGPC